MSGLCLVRNKFTPFKVQYAHLTIAIGLDSEVLAQGIDGFHTHTVQTHRLLESLGVILTASVEHADGFYKLALWNATAIVSDRYPQVVFDIHLYALSGIHLKLVDRVVDDLFQQDIDAVFGQRAVAQSSDIHAWTQADVLDACRGLNIFVGVSHGSLLLRRLVV